MGDHGVFEGQEDADVAARWIECSNEGDHEQGPKARDPGKASPGHGHQESGQEQSDAPRDPMGDKTDPQRQQGRAHQRRGRDDPDGEGIIPQLRQMERQQDGDVAVPRRPGEIVP
jgi:hypothetical protein